MSKIVGMMLLLIVLVNLCDNSASAQFPVTKSDIRKCRCKQISSGVFKCPKQLIPTHSQGKHALNKCLCRTGIEQDRPELLGFCRTLGSATPV